MGDTTNSKLSTSAFNETKNVKLTSQVNVRSKVKIATFRIICYWRELTIVANPIFVKMLYEG